MKFNKIIVFLSICLSIAAVYGGVNFFNANADNALPTHLLTGYWQNFNNGAKCLRINDVPAAYDIIAVAFADATTTPGQVSFTLDSGLAAALGGYTEEQFIADIQQVKARGQHVIISVGGQNGTVRVADAASAANFANSIYSLMTKYGFEGVDIDLENGVSATYMAQALRQLSTLAGSELIITMAPQTLDMQSTGTEYFKLALEIKDILTIVNMQYYNSGSMLGYDGKVYYQGTVEFLTALATIQLENGLKPEQVGLGLPASTSGAGSGYVDPSVVNAALNCLANGTTAGSFQPPHTYPKIRGAMTWSINWDASNNYYFSNSVKSCLNSLPGSEPATPAATATPSATTAPETTPTATANPVLTPTPAAYPAWAPNTAYAVGTIVSYNGLYYRCIQAHTTLTGWEPPIVPALWQQVEVSAPDPTATATANPNPNPSPVVTIQPTATPTPAATPPSSSYPAWAPNTSYKVGSIVSYNGFNYRCIQAHTSLTGWEPPIVPALWQVFFTVQPTPTATLIPTPTATLIPTPTTSASPTPTSTPQPPGPISGVWPDRVFAPYVDVMLWPTFSINSCYDLTSQKYYTLAFVTANANGDPAWGGITPMDQDWYLTEINNIRLKGGDVIVSFGGANGTELACSSANTNVSALQAKYQSVIDKYQLSWIDFDIEGASVADSASIDRRNKAIKGLQAANPNLKVAFCLPVLPSGLVDGVNVLENAVANGVRVDLVNVMAMDYGDWAAPNPDGKMGEYAIQAAENTYKQCQRLGINPKIGITPMIGRNDVATETFYLTDATKILNFAQSTSWMGMLSMWSVNRDNGNGGALYASSQLNQNLYDFTNILKEYK
jgi:chitinase/chitodextrinase